MKTTPKQRGTEDRPPAHPAAELFPLLEGAAYDSFKADIREHGQREPVVMLEGQILDGRNRYRACVELGIEPQTREWGSRPTDGSSPTAYSLSVNGPGRRHVAPRDLTIAIANAVPLFEAEAKAAQIAGLKQGEQTPVSANLHERGRATERAIRAAGAAGQISPRTVADAVKVQREGIPELVGAMKRGEVSISAAARVAALPQAEQREAVRRRETKAPAPRIQTKAKKSSAESKPPGGAPMEAAPAAEQSTWQAVIEIGTPDRFCVADDLGPYHYSLSLACEHEVPIAIYIGQPFPSVMRCPEGCPTRPSERIMGPPEPQRKIISARKVNETPESDCYAVEMECGHSDLYSRPSGRPLLSHCYCYWCWRDDRDEAEGGNRKRTFQIARGILEALNDPRENSRLGLPSVPFKKLRSESPECCFCGHKFSGTDPTFHDADFGHYCETCHKEEIETIKPDAAAYAAEHCTLTERGTNDDELIDDVKADNELSASVYRAAIKIRAAQLVAEAAKATGSKRA